jgi:hypothetical protein
MRITHTDRKRPTTLEGFKDPRPIILHENAGQSFKQPANSAAPGKQLYQQVDTINRRISFSLHNASAKAKYQGIPKHF